MVQTAIVATAPPAPSTAAGDATVGTRADRPGAAARVGSSAIRDLLELTERPEIISFAGGLPDPATFPADAIAAATARVLETDPGAALQYSTTEGHPGLRAWIADRRGAATGAVLITHGSQQALDLVARTLLEPGDAVVLADPAYVGALQVLRLAQADLIGVPSDEDGLRVDLLARRLAAGLRPRLVYVVATFDNPSGSTLSAARRAALADLADRYGFWIVDDDPYGELHWPGPDGAAAPAGPSLRQLSDRVITLGSFSKILSPGLRLGYLVAPEALTRELAINKQATDLHTSTLSQRVVHEIVAEPGFLDAHLDRIRAVYATRSAALADALVAELGEHLRFARPRGGMFVWARVEGGGPVDTQARLSVALAHGVAYVPGAAFAVDRAATAPLPTLRLSFAGAPVEAFAEGARRLRAALVP